MKESPLAIVSIFFCTGIWIAKFVHIPLFLIWTFIFLFLLLAFICLKRSLLFSLFLGLSIFFAGLLHFENAQIQPFNHISRFISDNPLKVYIRGNVATYPEVTLTFYHNKKTTFIFKVEDLRIEGKWHKVQGLIKAIVYGDREIQYGSELLVEGSLMKPGGLRNPGGFNYSRYLANYNIFGILKVKKEDIFKSISSNKTSFFIRHIFKFSIRHIFKFRQKLRYIIFKNLKFEQGTLLSAILLGERSGLPRNIKDSFINTGTVHILAISGLHVGLIAFVLIYLFKTLRLGRKLTFTFTIFLLIGYAFLSGGRPSVVRATIMATVVLFGLLINREIRIYNLLGLAALSILIYNPNYLFDSGFQLSFSSVISIIYFAPKIEKFFSRLNHYPVCLIRAFSVSLAAWLGIAPLVAFYFNIITPVAILANLVVIPCLFLTVSAGLCFLVFAYLWMPLGAIFAATTQLSLIVLSRLTEFISRIPFAFFYVCRPDIFFFCSYYLLLLLIFNYKRLNISSGRLCIILLSVANLLTWKPLFKTPSDNRLTVTFFDVGHGSAIFVEFPYQGAMLIDGGPGGENDAGRLVILPFLWNKGIELIDAIILTHPDNDHAGGLISVLKNIKVNWVFDSGMAGKSETYYNYKKMVDDRISNYYSIKRGEQILGFPQVKLFVLHPPEPFLTGTESDINNNSLVLKLVYKDVSFIFCADIQKQAIEQLLSYGSMLKSSVIEVPHHGSDEEEAGDWFLRAVSPQLAVISAGRSGRLGFPSPKVVNRLKQLGAKIYKTGDCGAVIISTDGRNIWVETMIED